MKQKRPNLALFDPDAPRKMLAAAKDEIEWGILYLMLNEGMHPEQIRRLKPKQFDPVTGLLEWVRVKNKRPRHTLIPEADRQRLAAFLKLRKLSNWSMWERIVKLGERIGYPATPRNLRHTFILNELRRYKERPDVMDLVAARAGCSRSTVIQHYLDLEQWTSR